MNVNWSRYAGTALLAGLAMAAGFWLASYDRSPDAGQTRVADFQGHTLNPPRRIAVPALDKDDGTPFTESDISGHWSLMYFGYTHCPDVCPATLSTLAAAKKAAAEKRPGWAFPRVIFVSVDPGRDTKDLLHKYVRYFDPDFTAVTGDEKMIQALTLQMSVVYMKVPAESSGNPATGDSNYLVDHSASILLLNPEGQLAAFLQPPHTPQSLLDSIDKLVRE